MELELARNVERLRSGGAMSPILDGRFRQAVPREYDGLALDQSWSRLKAENLAAMGGIEPRRKAAVVVTAKNEGIYFLDWLAHQRAVGFQGVFVYSNDNTDGSEALFELLAQHKLITYLQNDVGPAKSPQIKAYEHSIHFLTELRDFAWAAYFDVDELLVP